MKKLSIYLTAVVAVFVVSQAIASSKAEKKSRHLISMPKFSAVTGSGSCTAEAAEYAAARLAFEDAVQAADDAYDDWMECENGSMTPDSIEIPDSPSVLLRD